MDSREELERSPIATRVLGRILDPREHLDYAWLALFAALPLGVSWLIGADDTLVRPLREGGEDVEFAGYWDRGMWVGLVVLLPCVVFLMRWVMDRIAPVSQAWPSQSVPAIVGLIESDPGRRKAYEALRGALLSPRNLIAALAFTAAFHVADMWNLAGFFLADPGTVGPEGPYLTVESGIPFCCEAEADWSSMFLSTETGIGRWESLALNAIAYSVQFSALLICFLLTISLVRHNLFFLFRIYQRRRVPEGEESGYIHIDLDDDDKCFGFRRANHAFNVQVMVFAIVAACLLGTRFANVDSESGLLRDAGQWLTMIVLAGALAMVSLPVVIKLLPFLPAGGGQRAPASLVGYLREFLSDDAWDQAKTPVDAVAARFAENAFWPTGNNRARPIFFFAFWTFFVALVPVPWALTMFKNASAWWLPVCWAVSGVVALGATWVLFAVLRGMLGYIDPRLVELPEHPIEISTRPARIETSVFISYRRDDTAAYAGRLRDGLKERLDPERIFMDIATVGLGANFVEAIEEAIGSARLMIVLIGPQWLTIAGDDGRPRIEQADDVVHQEVALGLARGIEVLPILVGGVSMPSATELPEDLRRLVHLNAHEISDKRWEYDLGVLLDHLAELPPA